jgi:hypothetical protein
MKWNFILPVPGNWFNKTPVALLAGILLIFSQRVNAQQSQTGCNSGNCTDGEGTYIYTDGSKYTGEFLNGKADGYGVVIYADGRKYVGEFRNHKAAGQGAWYGADGSIEPGYYDANESWIKAANAKKGCLEGNCENGYGVKYWDENVKYIGDFKNSVCEGYGTCYFSDGSKYTGNWLNHKFEGEGTRYYADGTIQRGFFKEGNYTGATGTAQAAQTEGGCLKGDCKDGVGTYVYNDGSRYIGEFKDGKCEGFGVCYFASGKTWVGEFHAHSVSGQGAWYYKDGKVEPGYFDANSDFIKAADAKKGCLSGDCSNGYGTKYWDEGTKYVGDFKAGLCEGTGTCYFNDGSMYVGGWANHKFNGLGTRYYKDGTIETGNFRDGNFLGKDLVNGCISGNCENGFGIFRWSSGDTYSGEFKDSQLTGYGNYFYSNGDKYVGNMVDAKFEGQGTYTYADGTVETGTWHDSKLETSSNEQSLKADITWNDPSSSLTTTTYNSYEIKACINSNTDVKSVQLSVNNKIISTDTRFREDPLSGCKVVYSKSVDLIPGTNRITLLVQNDAGSTESTERVIELATGVQQKRLALVIGNSDYLNANGLKNPVNDARAMATVLESLGFKVIKIENATSKQMKMAIDEFGAELEKYNVGLFYYAGHGIQVKGLNYLVPVDAEIKSESQVEYDCIQADRVMSFMDYAKTDVNIIILDACRNNPFKRSWSRSTETEGLAFMNAPSGTLIAYATAPGHTASDGSGSNGLYTESLLQKIKDPNLSILQVFQQVRSRVLEKSEKAQNPWESTSLTGDFYFTKH